MSQTAFVAAAFKSEVQCGHRTAPSGMPVRQNGQSCVVGAAAGTGRTRLTARTRMNTAKATIENSRIVFRKIP